MGQTGGVDVGAMCWQLGGWSLGISDVSVAPRSAARVAATENDDVCLQILEFIVTLNQVHLPRPESWRPMGGAKWGQPVETFRRRRTGHQGSPS
jgi:hypothetical protein